MIKLWVIINMNLKGKYTLKCLRFLVFWIVFPLMLFIVYRFKFEYEKLKGLIELFEVI